MELITQSLLQTSGSSQIVRDSSLILYLDPITYPGSGTALTDLSGNNRNGTLTNGPTYNSANGGTIVFDGTNDYITCGNYSFNTAQGTLSFWFKPTTSITAAVNKRPWGFAQDFESKFANQAGAMNFDIGGTENLISTQTVWLNTTWYNVVLTWDTSVLTSKFYVQNILDKTGTTGTTAAFTAQTGNFYIGTSSANAGYWDFSMSMFTIYNRVLNEQELTQNFNATRGRFGV